MPGCFAETSGSPVKKSCLVTAFLERPGGEEDVYLSSTQRTEVLVNKQQSHLIVRWTPFLFRLSAALMT